MARQEARYASRAAEPTGAAGPAAVSGFRPDIEGLRAVAVVLVILDHLVGWPTGGFVGVDVFFVISGFLITDLLLREQAKYGSISFSNFYARRVRRIMPVAVVVLAVTVGVSWIVYFSARAESIVGDALASLFFVENWHLIGSGTDYLQPSAAVSPLQHFWSLSVEEQYYVVWPWVIVLLVAFALRRKLSSRATTRLIAVVLIVAVVVSFAWSIYETRTRPNWSYFSTVSRAWELGIGGILAVFAPKIRALPMRGRLLLAWIGLAGIVASCLLLTTGSAFPGPWAILPVVSTALIIGSGIGARIRGLWPLTNAGSRFVGKISYSLYLWHFPVIVILASLIPEASASYIPLALLLMFGLSIASFFLVEQPVRRSRWLAPKPRSADERRRPVRMIAGASSGVAIALVAGLILVLGTGGAAETAGSRTPAPVAEYSAQALVSEEVEESLDATHWSTVSPSIATVSSADAAPQLDAGSKGLHCISDPIGANIQSIDTSEAECVYGPATFDRTVVVVGDSIAASWMPGLIEADALASARVIGLTYNSCPASTVDVTELRNRAGFAAACDASRDRVFARLAELKPDLVIMSSAEASIVRLVSGATGEAATAEWQQGTLDAIQRISPTTKQIAVVSAPPEGLAPSDCAVKVGSPTSCISPISAAWKEKAAAESAAVQQASAAGVAVKYVDTSRWFCNEAGECPIFIGDVLTRIDQRHLTRAAAESMSELLSEALTS